MNALAKKWVKALRSGNYEQAKGKLKVADRFCCLGVLCEISGMGKWKRSRYYVGDFESENTDLPFQLLNAVGLGRRHTSSLMTLNDEGKTFKEISKEIVTMLGK